MPCPFSLTERGFSNPQEYADKNVRAPLDSELPALRTTKLERLRGSRKFSGSRRPLGFGYFSRQDAKDAELGN
jgi:hypothetical protein